MSLRNHSWREIIKILDNFGFHVPGQKESHIHLMHQDGRYVTVPRHDPVKEPTLKSILEQAGISKSEFLKEL